jgi:cell division protein FtsA
MGKLTYSDKDPPFPKAAEDSAQVDIGVVHVGIAGQHINSLQHRYSILRMSNTVEISRQEVDQMVDSMYRLPMETGSEIIHVLPQEFRVDHITGIKDPVGMSGVHVDADFHVITGKIASASMLTRCVIRAGLEVSDLILESIASAESVLHADEREAGVALVDIGGGTTDIAIFKDNIIRHSASIPLGGNIITHDIHLGCAIMAAQAERLKVQFGSALAMEVRDNEIVVVPNLQGRDPKDHSIACGRDG